MQTAHELFLHELSDMLDAERKIAEALEQQEQESSVSALGKAFGKHRQQTEKQIERLEQCFSELGQEPEQTECDGIKGLIEEHDHMKEEDPAPDILDMFNATAACKVERYEITSYESLIRMAGMMGHKKAAKLLRDNLKEEQQTLKIMQQFSRKLKPENLGMEEEEQEGAEVQSISRGRSSSRQRSRKAA